MRNLQGYNSRGRSRDPMPVSHQDMLFVIRELNMLVTSSDGKVSEYHALKKEVQWRNVLDEASLPSVP